MEFRKEALKSWVLSNMNKLWDKWKGFVSTNPVITADLVEREPAAFICSKVCTVNTVCCSYSRGLLGQVQILDTLSDHSLTSRSTQQNCVWRNMVRFAFEGSYVCVSTCWTLEVMVKLTSFGLSWIVGADLKATWRFDPHLRSIWGLPYFCGAEPFWTALEGFWR